MQKFIEDINSFIKEFKKKFFVDKSTEEYYREYNKKINDKRKNKTLIKRKSHIDMDFLYVLEYIFDYTNLESTQAS